jgi:hypothetical protein
MLSFAARSKVKVYALIFLAFALLPTSLTANHTASCVQWNIVSYTLRPLVGPFNESLSEYGVLFARSGEYVAVVILAIGTLTSNQLASFAPQETCNT